MYTYMYVCIYIYIYMYVIIYIYIYIYTSLNTNIRSIHCSLMSLSLESPTSPPAPQSESTCTALGAPVELLPVEPATAPVTFPPAPAPLWAGSVTWLFSWISATSVSVVVLPRLSEPVTCAVLFHVMGTISVTSRGFFTKDSSSALSPKPLGQQQNRLFAHIPPTIFTFSLNGSVECLGAGTLRGWKECLAWMLTTFFPASYNVPSVL